MEAKQIAIGVVVKFVFDINVHAFTGVAVHG